MGARNGIEAGAPLYKVLMRTTNVLSKATADARAPARRLVPRSTWLEFDPFVVPAGRTPLGGIRPRQRVAVTGHVVATACAQWAGGPALEATIDDGTGAAVLAFPGRRQVAGLDVGRRLTAGGTVLRHRGRLILMNPHLWLGAADTLDVRAD